MLNEHRRLLYVALTRARDRLYVCGFQGKNGHASAGLVPADGTGGARAWAWRSRAAMA